MHPKLHFVHILVIIDLINKYQLLNITLNERYFTMKVSWFFLGFVISYKTKKNFTFLKYVYIEKKNVSLNVKML